MIRITENGRVAVLREEDENYPGKGIFTSVRIGRIDGTSFHEGTGVISVSFSEQDDSDQKSVSNVTIEEYNQLIDAMI